uniref:PSD1 domain-containing protein n=1 Tax=Panagrellus redivivus TaxID=6233 RepID=A0A7E4VJD2_PANRE
MRQFKPLALLYVFSTKSAAPKNRRLHRTKPLDRGVRYVLTKKQYTDLVDLATTSATDHDDIAAWSMNLTSRAREKLIRVIKEDYKGSPQTRHTARQYANQASPKVQEAFNCYNELLNNRNLNMVEIMSILHTIDATSWKPEDLMVFDRLITAQMDFTFEA